MKKTNILSLAAAILALGVTNASAILITTQIDGGNTGTDNVLFNSSPLDNGMLVKGTFNSEPTFVIDFTSTTALQVSGGQASLQPATANTFTDLKFQLENGATFTKAILNPDVDPTNGTINFTINYNIGGQQFLQSFAVGASGSNFFTIQAEGAETINFVSFTVSGTFIVDTNQVRVGGFAPGVVVPDGGATVALLGAALTGLAAARRFLLKV
jgi:hypothetical protein